MYLECGTLELREPDRLARLKSLASDAHELCLDLRPTVVVLELAHVGINPQAGLAIAEARGVIMGVVFELGIELAQYQPSQAKQVVTGRGNASKDHVSAQLCRMLCLARAPKLDATDALALAVTHTVLGRSR